MCFVYFVVTQKMIPLRQIAHARSGDKGSSANVAVFARTPAAYVFLRDHLTAALALWEYVDASAKYVFGDTLGDPVADDILRALRAAPEGLSRTEIRELFQRHQSSERVGQALALLVTHHRAKSVMQTDTGGRPAERWKAVRPGEEVEQEAAR